MKPGEPCAQCSHGEHAMDVTHTVIPAIGFLRPRARESAESFAPNFAIPDRYIPRDHPRSSAQPLINPESKFTAEAGHIGAKEIFVSVAKIHQPHDEIAAARIAVTTQIRCPLAPALEYRLDLLKRALAQINATYVLEQLLSGTAQPSLLYLCGSTQQPNQKDVGNRHKGRQFQSSAVESHDGIDTTHPKLVPVLVPEFSCDLASE